MTRVRPHLLILATLAAAIGAGCDDDHHDDDPEAVAEEACEHRVEGPFQPVTAAQGTDAVPDATFAHTSIQVTLADPDADGTFSGVVRYAADTAGDVIVFVSVPVTLQVTALDGALVSVEEVIPVTLCEEVAEGHRVELEVGSYDLAFEASVAELGIVIEYNEAHAHP